MNNIYTATISVITATYNRPEGLKRAIKTLQNQTYWNYQHIIIDDGAIYDVKHIVEKYGDNRIKLICHSVNRGYLHAKNTGLDNIDGDWFTFLDDDDELYPNALETLINVHYKIDNKINAVSCNCIDTSTNAFSGFGVSKDQYLDLRTIFSKLHGEHWGITHTSLLGKDRFNPILKSDGSLWYKINLRAKRYYIHKALRIFHTDGKDRTTLVNKKLSYDERYAIAKERLKESAYLNMIKKYDKKKFIKVCLYGLIYSRIKKDIQSTKKYLEYLFNLAITKK